MKSFSCEEAQRCLEDRATGDLTERDRKALDVHLAICEDCRESEDIWRRVGTAMRDVPLRSPSPQIEQMIRTGQPMPADRTGRRGGWRMAGLAAACLATVIAVGLLIRRAEPPPEIDVEPQTLATDADEPEPAEHPPAPAVVAQGRRQLAGVADGTGLWMEDGAVVRTLRNDTQEAHFLLERGTAVAVVGPNEAGYRFRVETPRALVTAHGTIFSVRVDDDQGELYRVIEGDVEVVDKGGGEQRVEAGLELSAGQTGAEEAAVDRLLGDLLIASWPADEAIAFVDQIHRRLTVGPSESGSDVPAADDAVGAVTIPGTHIDELTLLARQHQLDREFEAASVVYEELISTYPVDRAAWYSHVALGQMKLNAMARPDEALVHFNEYLSLEPAGTLSEEARFGRVKALSQLGRLAEAIAAATDYLERHPNGYGGPEVLRVRAAAYRSVEQWDEAASDYRTIIERWPESTQATTAHSALAALPGSP